MAASTMGEALIQNPAQEEEESTVTAENEKQSTTGGGKDATEVGVSMGVGNAPKKKKKRSKNSKMKHGLNQPTGFEEWFVDAPMTPEEHMEELSLYDLSKDFQDRIEIAIQRFTSRRKFGEWQKELFDKYLQFGGFDTGPSQFSSGEIDEQNEDLTAADISHMKATKVVSKWVLDGEGVVDFDGVLKAFVSTYVVRLFAPQSKDEVKARINILRSFFNYLLHHEVCPEYKEQIEASRKTCDQAEHELWLIMGGASKLPGDFNQACSTIFGGYYHNLFGGEDAYPGSDPKFGLSKKDTRTLFMAGIVASSEDVCQDYQEKNNAGGVKLVDSSTSCLKVTGITMPSEEVRAYYSDTAALYGRRPIGLLKCQTIIDPHAPPEDLTEEEEAERVTKGTEVKKYVFNVEDQVLECMFVGMVMKVTIHKTNFGLYYFDNVLSTMVSFHTNIPNSDMEGWKEHVYLQPRERHEGPSLQAFIPDRVGQVSYNHDGEQVETENPRLAQYEKGEDIVVEC